MFKIKYVVKYASFPKYLCFFFLFKEEWNITSEVEFVLHVCEVSGLLLDKLLLWWCIFLTKLALQL